MAKISNLDFILRVAKVLGERYQIEEVAPAASDYLDIKVTNVYGITRYISVAKSALEDVDTPGGGADLIFNAANAIKVSFQ